MADSRRLLLSLIDKLLENVRLAAAESKSLGRVIAHICHIDYGDAQSATVYLKERGFSTHADRLTRDVGDLFQKTSEFRGPLVAEPKYDDRKQEEHDLAALRSEAHRLFRFLSELRSLVDEDDGTIPPEPPGYWQRKLPDFIPNVISLELTTPPRITQNLARATDGRYFLVWWDSAKGLYNWSLISNDYARELAEPVRKYRGLDDWLQVFSVDDVRAKFHDLLTWVRRNLKKKQLRVMEMTIEEGGECPLSSIAIDRIVSWEAPYDNAFNGICKAVNPKLKRAKMSWKLERNDNHARLAKTGQK